MSESRKEREFRLREAEILSTALALFDADGLDNVTVAQIAKATDIGKGTIYKHFASKDEIFARLSIDFSKEMFEQAAQQAQQGNCFQRMKVLFEVCFGKHLESPLLGEICMRCEHPDFRQNLSATLHQQSELLQHDFFALLSDIVAQGVEEGELPELPLEELLCGAHATFSGAVKMLRDRSRKCFDHTEELSEQRFIELIVQFTMAGLFGLKNVNLS